VKIDSSVPTPASRRAKLPIKETLAQMSPGDSVLVDTLSIVSSFSAAAKRAGVTITSKKEDGKIRIWRTK
jgi:hypothetical protein